MTRPESSQIESKLLVDSPMSSTEQCRFIKESSLINTKSLIKSSTTMLPSEINSVSKPSTLLNYSSKTSTLKDCVLANTKPKIDNITFRQSFSNSVENISSLEDVPIRSPVYNSDTKLKKVLNSKLQNPMEMDFQTYQSLAEGERTGKPLSLKSILHKRTLRDTISSGQIKNTPSLQTQHKKVSFAQNRVLLIYNTEPISQDDSYPDDYDLCEV